MRIVSAIGGGVALFVLFGAVAIGIFAIAAAAAKKRREAYLLLGQKLGMQVDFADAIGLRSSGFGLFDDGHSRKVSALLRGPDEGAFANELRCAFEYQYTTGSGDSQQTYQFIGAMLPIPANVPRLTIGREVFGRKLLSALGMGDIELESAEFNAAFRIAGAGQKLAFAALDGRLQEWLSVRAGDGWTNIEMLGSNVLVVQKGRDMNRIEGLLEFAEQFRDQIPTVVSEMYPRGTPASPESSHPGAPA